MRTVLVTGSNTGVGKTRVVAALARMLSAGGARVQIVKVVETGRGLGTFSESDADCARRLSGSDVVALTLASFAEPLAPFAAARLEGMEISLAKLVEETRALPECDWRIMEGAGGIATPVDAEGRDWADFAVAVPVDAVVVVVPDQLGAINQARLAYARAMACGVRAGVWLNATSSVDPAVAAANREGLAAARVPLWAEQAHDALLPRWPERTQQVLEKNVETNQSGETTDRPEVDADKIPQRYQRFLDERERQGLRRSLRVTESLDGLLNLADNDYLALARDPSVAAAVAAAVVEHGTSASASPLITGWRAPHERLLGELCGWHGFPCGMLWSSGYAANSAVLSLLPARGDLVLADRLIHHSMITGLLRSGARIRRYEHLQLDNLEEMLIQAAASGRTVFVATESVFSMDGGFPDFVRLAQLKQRYGFQLIVDEAHALGWYGPEGSGLVRLAGMEEAVDVLIGTLGKTLASGGAYTLFRDAVARDYLVNQAGEFIYSTALSPINAAAASAALARVRALSSQQPEWHERSRSFRAQLQAAGWETSAGDSPVVPVRLDSADAAISAAGALRENGILAAAVRPPTVPAGTSRLRFSLKRTFDETAAFRVLNALAEWRTTR
jgi:8-amino-7-oxononanoate synthase